MNAVRSGASWRWLWILLVAALAASAAARGGAPAEGVRIVRHDARFDRLVPPGAVVETAAGGFEWVEGPAWNRQGGFLLVSDVPANSVRKYRPGEGVSLFLKPSGYTGTAPFAGREPGSNGLAFDSQGRLVMCEHGDRRIARLEADGRKTTLADRYRSERLNSPNDLVFSARGDLYFTDPPFGLPGAFDDPAKELDFQGVYLLRASGELLLLTRELSAPNGIGFAPSGTTLYVSNADRQRAVWMAYDLAADGTIAGAGRVLFDGTSLFGEDRQGVPDGLKVDRDGNLFAAGPGGIYVIAPDGTLLGWIDTGGPTGNCAFAEDGSVLYIAANHRLLRLQTATRGQGF